MKILHTSDLHLNSKMDTKLGKDKAKERKRELLLNFRKMTEIAKDEGCRAFIIAGDLFDSEKISVSVKKNVLDIIEAASELSFFYLPGNHEADALLGEELLPKNLFVFGLDWTYFTIGKVAFAGRRNTESEMFSSLKKPDSAEKLIVVLHGELADKSKPGGYIGTRELHGTDIDYLALGHYHSYSSFEFKKERFATYSGTPLGRGFDESGECGYVIIDATEYVSFSFRKTNGRRLVIKEIDVTEIFGTHELCDKISHACRDIPSSNLLRVNLIGKKSPELKFDLSYAEERLKGRFYYFEIKDATRLKISSDDYANDKSLKGEFIRLVLSDGTLSEKEKKDIISTGISALMGEGI